VEKLEAENVEFDNKLHALSIEGIDSDGRSSVEVCNDWFATRFAKLDALRQLRKRLTEQTGIFEAVSKSLARSIDTAQQSLSDGIEEAKRQMTEAGSGIDTIPGSNGGRLVDLNPKAAQVQFNHRAKQNSNVIPLIESLEQLRSESRDMAAQKKNANDRLTEVEVEINDLWGLISGSPKVMGSGSRVR